MSNSAGTPDDLGNEHVILLLLTAQAKAIEKSLGVPVLRHALKKPAAATDLCDFLSLKPNQIVFVGDRLMTDMLYGNLVGMETIYVREIISSQNDNWIAARVRFFWIADARASCGDGSIRW